MILSSSVKSACVAIALSGFSPPQAGAIEMQGSNPAPMLNDGMISKAYIAHRGVTAVGHAAASIIVAGQLAAIVAAMATAAASTAAGFIEAEFTAEATAAGPGPGGIVGAQAAR